MSVTVDGVERQDKVIPLVDDRQEHSVEVRIAPPAMDPVCRVSPQWESRGGDQDNPAQLVSTSNHR